MTRRQFRTLALLVLWLLPAVLAPATPIANAAASEWFFVSGDLDGDGMPNEVEEDGWCNAAGCFETDPLDSDSDDDGLTDGQEKLYETNPLDDQSPGVYVEYENHLKTRQYYARDPHSLPANWGWQQRGDRYISFNAVVVRRGATFSVGGPPDATLQVIKSIGGLSDLTPVRDPCSGRWRISVPPSGTVGKYEIRAEDGAWSKSLNLYVIFELPTPTAGFTQAMIDAFVYDDNVGNLKDERGILLGDLTYTQSSPGTGWIPADSQINAGGGWRFELQQFEPFVLDEHVIGAINGKTTQSAAATALLNRADQVTRFVWPAVRVTSWEVLHPTGEYGDGSQCSMVSGLVTAFERSAGIPARPFFVDWRTGTFDHADEIWLNGDWNSARGYATSTEPQGCGWDCAGGIVSLRSRQSWGSVYKPWHSNGGGSGTVIAAAREDWTWSGTWIPDPWNPDQEEYRWPNWNWDSIVRHAWFETLFVPYWSGRGWTQEPQIVGTPPGAWPTEITSFSLDASPNSQSVAQGETASYAVNLSTLDGFDNGVSLSVSGLHSSMTHKFLPDTYCVPNCARTLLITTTASTPLGTYQPRILGRGGRESQEIVDLEVIVPPGGPAGAPLSAASADGQPPLVAEGVQDYGVDLDGDGYFDQLVVEVAVEASRPGTYWLRGMLGSDSYAPALALSGGIIADSMVQVNLAQGANSVQLVFDGLNISGSRVDGPYVLTYLHATDAAEPSTEDFVNNNLAEWDSPYTTAPYQAYDFENRGALLTGEVDEQGSDGDGDGLYDALILNVGLKAFEPGAYTVQGDLYDAQEQFVASATWTGTGESAALRFDEIEGTQGPYLLKKLTLLNAGGEIIDSMSNAYVTQQVIRADWGTSLAPAQAGGEVGAQLILPGAYTHARVDTDGNGKYDYLVITTTLTVETGEGGQAYRLEGWLVDKNGSLVSWTSSDSKTLPEGTHAFALPFSGRIINERGADGPYTLVALKALPSGSYQILDQVQVAYTTPAYNHGDFEEPVGVSTAATAFLDNMEDGQGAWSSQIPWSLSSERWHSYSHAWRADASGTGTGRLGISIDLSGYSDPTLRLKTCYSMQSPNDAGYIEASGNGLDWTRVATYTDSSTHWSTEIVSLQGLGSNSTVQLRFNANSQNGLRWYVDDVAVNAWVDSDGDGLGDERETTHGTNPGDPDSDDDGLLDGAEVNVHETDPLDDDTDGDGMPDGWEVDNGLNPVVNDANQDPDSDGLTNLEEYQELTDPQDDDTDGDGMPDGWEVDNGLNPLIDDTGLDADSDGLSNLEEYAHGTDPQDADTDNDSLSDSDEITIGTDPTDPDSDGDDIPDGVEVGDPNDPTNTDGDTAIDALDQDSDDDGIPDGHEWDADGKGPLDDLCSNTSFDSDGDGIPNCMDNDADGDGTPNFQDVDADDDGLLDSAEGVLDDEEDGILNFLDPDPEFNPSVRRTFLPFILK
jgi:hypothetical protein